MSPLPGTNQHWCHKRNHGRDPCGVRTQDLEVARQTSYPLGNHSSKICLYYTSNMIREVERIKHPDTRISSAYQGHPLDIIYVITKFQVISCVYIILNA